METLNLVAQYLPRLLYGAFLTLMVAVISFVLSFIVGMVMAQMRLSRLAWVRWLASAYSSILRGVPELVWMLLLSMYTEPSYAQG